MSSILTFRYINGDRKSALQAVELPTLPLTLDETVRLLPESAYTTFRTYPKGSALHLNDHFQRLEESSRLAGYPINLDRDQLRTNIRLALLQYSAEVARVRVMVPFSIKNREVYICIGALSVPTAEKREAGVKVITREIHRKQPKAKLTGFISSTQALRDILKDDVEEILMVDEHGNILEGLSSNFFAVINGAVVTAGEGVLPGITRQIVLDLVLSEGIEVKFTPPLMSKIHTFSEAFITSTSRGVLPVIGINSQIIGEGKPGEISQLLMNRYEIRVLEETQPI